MATFLLIHGAFRAGFSFSRLRPYLLARGHQVYAPSLPGAGENAPHAPSVLTLRDYATYVADFCELEDLEQVVLVGHSQGGVVISAASELAYARIRRLVFLDAPVPRHGERAIDLVAPGLSHAATPELAHDTWLEPRPLVAGADLSSTDAAWLNARLCKTPVGPALDRLVLTHPAALTLPRSYLFCTRTPDTFPCAHGRARLDAEGTDYTWLEAGHDAPFTAPALVCDALCGIVAADDGAHERP